MHTQCSVQDTCALLFTNFLGVTELWLLVQSSSPFASLLSSNFCHPILKGVYYQKITNKFLRQTQNCLQENSLKLLLTLCN